MLFDFPFNLPDYLHRVGRTGRVGSQVLRPRVTTFMTHRKDVQMAWKLKEAAEKQVAIMEQRAVRAMARREQEVSTGQTPGQQKQPRTHF